MLNVQPRFGSRLDSKVIDLGDGDLSLNGVVGRGDRELTGGEAVWRFTPLLAML